jgi:uncharacterized protein
MISLDDIKSAAKEIVARFHPQRIVLFGSYANGNPNKDSDVDLLILINGRNVHDQAITIRQAIDFGFPVDLLVRSPQEFERRIDSGDFFLKEIQEKGRTLYEAPGARVGGKSRGRFRHSTARSTGKKVAQLR